jgi:hypothetical protein
MVTPEPYHQLMVVVSATALPASSTISKCVVCGPSPELPFPVISEDGVARSSAIVARCASAHLGERSSSMGLVTKSGSPSRALREANERRIASNTK